MRTAPLALAALTVLVATAAQATALWEDPWNDDCEPPATKLGHIEAHTAAEIADPSSDRAITLYVNGLTSNDPIHSALAEAISEGVEVKIYVALNGYVATLSGATMVYTSEPSLPDLVVFDYEDSQYALGATTSEIRVSTNVSAIETWLGL